MQLGGSVADDPGDDRTGAPVEAARAAWGVDEPLHAATIAPTERPPRRRSALRRSRPPSASLTGAVWHGPPPVEPAAGAAPARGAARQRAAAGSERSGVDADERGGHRPGAGALHREGDVEEEVVGVV